ncbi:MULTISPECIES: hypothetical protein [Paenibacillus]|uniref:hypothetical protein n=1 Tax=Paenibacillus TaxID=44249 RepID=UPI001164AE2E|nr:MULTISPECIES: hypothetical protein [Paenibacillus]AWP25242.1 hypothetical protein B9D94_00745 [Paenibacillus sp. Cedars]MBX4152461.1 hypothetical protein [Paenibacillus lautus]
MIDLETVFEKDGLRMLRVYKDDRLILSLPNVNQISALESRIDSEQFDTIEEAVDFIKNKELYCRNSYSLHLIVRAYDIVDEHYIRIYYNIHTSGC